MISREKLVDYVLRNRITVTRDVDLDGAFLSASKTCIELDPLLHAINSSELNADESAELTQARAEIERLRQELNEERAIVQRPAITGEPK